MRKNFSRVITAIVTIAIILSTATTVMAATNNETVQATIAREVIVTYNGVKQSFTDANGKQVYPITYNGTTLLPVRATSKLFNYAINWNSETNTVAIDSTKPYIGTNNESTMISDALKKNELTNIVISHDLKVTFDGEIKSFYDVNNKQVFPMVLNGTTYLPVRAVSKLANTPIEWIANENRVAIGTGVYVPEVPVLPKSNENNDIVNSTRVIGKYASISSDSSKLSQPAKTIFGDNTFLQFKFDGDMNGIAEENHRVEVPLAATEKFVSFTVVNQSTREIKFAVYCHTSEGRQTSLNRVVPSGESKEITLSVLDTAYLHFFMSTRGGVGDAFQPFDVVVSNFEYHDTFEK